MENYRSVSMEMRQHGGGSFPQFPALEFNSDTAISDDFFTLDPNVFFTSSVDNIVSDFSSLLDSTSQNSFDPGALSQSGLPNGSMLPADEWSGTTNALPGTPSSQHLQHGLESSSPLHSQAQPLQPVQASKQQHYMFENHMTGSSQTSQEVLGNQQHIDQKPTSEQLEFVTAQAKSQQLGFQGGNSQLGMHAVKVENLHPVKLENQGAQGNSRPGTFINQPGELHGCSTFSSEQPLAQSMSNNVHDVAMQDHHFQGLQSSAQQSDFDGAGAQQHIYQQSRSFDALQGRAMPPHLAGFQSAQAGESQQSATHRTQGSSPQINFSKIPMTNHHFSLPGNTSAPQMGLQNQQSSMNHLQGLDSESNQALVQSQMATNQASYSVHGGSLQSRFMPKPSSHQSLLQNHPLSSQIPSFQMQHNNHQLQGQGHGQAQAKALSQVAQLNSQQAAANQQALLQPRQVQLSHQQPVFSTNQQPPYQLLQSQGYQVHQNSAGHLPGGARQMFSQMQPRLQSHILQGLKIAPRQLGQSFAGSPLAGAMETGGRYPLPPTHAAKCIQVFMLYIQEQRKRPPDNNIGFWRNLVQKFFAQGATKRWCLTSYNKSPVGRHAQGLFPMDYWFCNLCGVQPGRGFESSTDVLPRLFKIKYDSGLVDELLFLDIPTDKYVLPSGKVVLEYANAVHESVFQELRVVRYGKLRVTFGNNFKICAWEFCTTNHEEVVPRKNLLQQVQQLASLVVESDHEGFDRSAENLKSHCNMFTKTAKQLAVQLDAPMVNDLGFSKRYVRCLQIAEVVNSMKDLISFERKTGLGPIESLAKFPSGRKLQMEGALSGMSPSMSLSQMINEITQGSHVGQPSLQMSTITSRLPSESMTEMQGQTYSHGQSALFKGVDPNMAQSINQMQPQFRSQMESRLSHLFQSQAYNHMQPSIGSQAQSVGLVQSLSANQLSQLTAQGQTQCQLSSGQLGSQSLSQQQQQVYQQSILKSAPKSSSQVLSQPQSLNQASLPGTPQSEMSDMRSNT